MLASRRISEGDYLHLREFFARANLRYISYQQNRLPRIMGIAADSHGDKLRFAQKRPVEKLGDCYLKIVAPHEVT